MIVNKIHTYLTAVSNITVPIGSTRELAPSEILAADSTDYLLGGTLTMKNGAQLGSQRVGTITGSYEDFSFSFSNDIIGDGKDRFRSNAIEIGYGDFSIGTYVCTNDGMKESGYTKESWRSEKKNLLKEKKNIKDYPWKNGIVLSSPIWMSFKRNNIVQRIGVNYPPAQQATQNLLHRIIIYTVLQRNR